MNTTQNTPICALCAHTPICKNQPQQSCPYLQLKEKKPVEPVRANTTPRPQKTSFLHHLKTWTVRAVILAFLALAFLAGRVSMYPRIVSHLPKLPQNPTGGATPDAVVSQFINAVIRGDTQLALALLHPDAKNNQFPYFLEEMMDLTRDAPDFALASIEVEYVDILETVTLFVNVHAGTIHDAGEIHLKKSAGEWQITDVDM